ncbi:MAG: TCP-1/cpn60 chaperonin family protein, partial [Candidatus Poseidoniales archaeon]
IEVTNTGSLREFHDRSLIKIRKLVEHLTSLNIDLLIVRDGVAEDATSSLTKAGITVYRRLERQDIELLSKMTGANLIRNPLKIKDSDVGSYAKRNEKLISNIKHTT